MTIFEQIRYWIDKETMDFMLTVLFSSMVWSVIEGVISEKIESYKNKKEDDVM